MDDIDGLPAGIWQAVFRPQQQLPHLQELRLGGGFAVGNNAELQDPLAAACSAADISRLVECCPKLQELILVLQPDVQLAALSQLTALTSLTIWRAKEVSVKSLSGLTGLRKRCFHTV